MSDVGFSVWTEFGSYELIKSGLETPALGSDTYQPARRQPTPHSSQLTHLKNQGLEVRTLDFINGHVLKSCMCKTFMRAQGLLQIYSNSISRVVGFQP